MERTISTIGIFFLILAFINCSECRKCWHCENAMGNDECKRIGSLQQCLYGQEYCQNEIRAIAGGKYFEVTKRCKQERGCSNNGMQNFTGTVPFQCATEEPHSVCRCCCGFDNCNGQTIQCVKDKPRCPYPDSPANGYTSCPSFLLVGATCRYRCRPGYQLEGATSTTCEMTTDGVQWSAPPPQCVVKPCEPLSAPEEGSFTCTDEWNVASECTFTCNPGRVLVGQEVLKCSIFSIWDGVEPTCEAVECYPPRPLDPNFVPPRGVCTDGYKYESTCTFACGPNYDLVGEDQITCGPPIGSNNRATWSNRPPRCQPKPCRPLVAPEDGTVSCTDGWNDASECTFSCDEGHVLSGKEVLTCSDVTWDGDEPTCEVAECDPPSPLDPNFVPPEGQCTNGYNYDSTCTYACDPDYNLIGVDDITCGPPIQSNNRATWSDNPPRCQIKTCLPLYPECNGNEVGDTCLFSCGRCERLDGDSEITCTRDGWSGPRPDCVTRVCRTSPPSPANGAVSCGSDPVECDDSCTYTCNSGYNLVGSSQTRCLPNGGWSNPAPICELSECDPIDLSGIREVCSEGNAVGSTCQLSCEDDGMEFVGENQVRCKKDATDPAPVWDPVLTQYCRYILCPDFPVRNPRPDAGSLTCSPSSFRVTNDRDGRSGWRVNSKCSITCNENFQARNLLFESDCEENTEWTVVPLCCVECVINTALDVVVFLDRTEEALWDDRLTFIGRFLDFIVYTWEFNLNITFIPFGEEVEYANFINFMTIDDTDNLVIDLPGEVNFLKQRDEFIGIPSADGQDSNSGKALNEALRNIFGFHNNRVPMIFLVTTRAPSDLRLAQQASQELADRKIHLRIFPIVGVLSADPGTNQDVLESLVESPEYVVKGSREEDSADDFFLAAGEGLGPLTRRVCNQPAQQTQECLYES